MPGRTPRPEFAGKPAPTGARHLRRRFESIKVLNTHQGSSFPRLVSPRRRTDYALLSVVQEAYLLGTGTPGLAGLGHALGLPGISPENVEQLCREIDAQVRAFRTRRLDDQYPYLMVETIPQKYRENGRLHSAPVVVAAAVRADGEREIVAVDLAPARDPAYWVEFFAGLRGRGLQDVRLLTSAAYPGIKVAADLFPGVTWQLCREHFIETAMALLTESESPAIRRDLRLVFSNADTDSAASAIRRLRDQLSGTHPKLTSLLDEYEADLLSCYGFPRQHRERVWSTAILDRLMKELNRQCRVVAIFPTRQALLRLIGSVAQDRNEEWAAGFRYFSPTSMQRMASAA